MAKAPFRSACMAMALACGSAVVVHAQQGDEAVNRGQTAANLFATYCIGVESFDEKFRFLESNGWQSVAGDDRLNSQGRMTAHSNDDFPGLVITVFAPNDRPNAVGTCMVDGKDIDIAEILPAAISAYGRPEAVEGMAVWSAEEIRTRILIAKSWVQNHNFDPERAVLISIDFDYTPTPDAAD